MLTDDARVFPVTFNQNRRLALEEGMRAHGRSSAPFSLCSGFVLDVTTDEKEVQGILNAIARRHPGLRASFIRSPDLAQEHRDVALSALLRTGICPPGMFQQVIHEEPRIGVSSGSQELADTGPSLQAIARGLSATGVERDRGPLVRAGLFRLQNGPQVLLMVMPHLICDRRSLQVMGAELSAYWHPENGADGARVPEAEGCPLDITQEQDAERSGALSAAEAYWLGRWAEFESAQIRRSHIPFALPTLRAPTLAVATERRPLDEHVSEQLKTFAQSNRLTIYMVCLAALSLLLRRVLGRDRVVIWTNFPNRILGGAENAIGWFVNSHILGIDLTAATSVRALLDQVRVIVSEALEQQMLSLGRLWYSWQRCPVKGVRIGLDLTDHRTDESTSSRGAKRVGVPGARDGTVDLNFEIHIGPRTTVLAATYSVDLLVPYAVQQLLDRLQRVLSDLLSQRQREYVTTH